MYGECVITVIIVCCRDSMCVVFCGVGIQYCSLTPTLHSASVKITSQ